MAWFKATALPMIDRVSGYLTILDRHGIGWERLDTDTPGTVVYDDPWQIVAEPAPARGDRRPHRAGLWGPSVRP